MKYLMAEQVQNCSNTHYAVVSVIDIDRTSGAEQWFFIRQYFCTTFIQIANSVPGMPVK